MKLSLGIIKHAQLLHWGCAEILNAEIEYDMRHVGKYSFPLLQFEFNVGF